jgi:hypothetical protein
LQTPGLMVTGPGSGSVPAGALLMNSVAPATSLSTESWAVRRLFAPRLRQLRAAALQVLAEQRDGRDVFVPLGLHLRQVEEHAVLAGQVVGALELDQRRVQAALAIELDAALEVLGRFLLRRRLSEATSRRREQQHGGAKREREGGQLPAPVGARLV